MTLKASVNYHVQSHEAQAFQFDVDGISGNLIVPELVPTHVNVRDNRENSGNVNFANDGITFVTQPSHVTEFGDDNAWRSTYDQEIQALLSQEIGALEVIVFDHTVRIDDQQSARKPARNVHNDYSRDGANERLVHLVGEERAQAFQQGSFAFINVWRPISPVIISSPLGFIHPNSMDSEDWMTIDLVYPDRRGEILGVAANPKHEWFYQSNMRSDEVVIFNVGDEVYGCAGGLADLPGTLADYMVADADLIALKPKNFSMQEAAALPLVGITAYEGLKRANVDEGQNVLIHGGAGGVGHVAIQLARHLGANVFSTGSGESKLALIESLGATPIDYRSETVEEYVNKHTNGRGFDMVYDTVGGANMLNSFDAAALNGHVSSTVSMLEIDLTTVHFKGLSLHVVFMLIPMLHNQGRAVHGAILKEMAEIAESGALKAILDDTNFSLSQVGQAHERLASGKAIGKVVVSND